MQKQLQHRLACIGMFAILLILLSGCIFFPETVAEDLELTKITVTGIVDGDTIYVRFSSGKEEKVRLIGVDTPEINHPTKGEEPFGIEADQYTRSVLDNVNAWLEFDLGERDQYGRMLAYLWLERPEELSELEIRDKMFNAWLLIGGYASQVIFAPNVKYVDYFADFEVEARKAKRGLWAED
ncbi:MAG: thermonuclease family protein [Clostridia bacterium]|nr:thermonuclease family protein [Clostridia bacterium]